MDCSVLHPSLCLFLIFPLRRYRFRLLEVLLSVSSDAKDLAAKVARLSRSLQQAQAATPQPRINSWCFEVRKRERRPMSHTLLLTIHFYSMVLCGRAQTSLRRASAQI